MKTWVLFLIVAAVWAQLPSEGNAKSALTDAKRSPMAMSKTNLEKLVKRQTGISGGHRRRDAELQEFFHSEEVSEILAKSGITMSMLDYVIDNDDEIPEEDRDLIKMLVIMELAVDDSSEEDF